MPRKPYTFRHFCIDFMKLGGPALAIFWKEKAWERREAHVQHGTLAQQGWWDKWMLGSKQSCDRCYAWFDNRATMCPTCHRPVA